MELFVTGLLFGFGFLAAIFIVVAACLALVLIALFVSYLATKFGKRDSGKGTRNGSDAGR